MGICLSSDRFNVAPLNSIEVSLFLSSEAITFALCSIQLQSQISSVEFWLISKGGALLVWGRGEGVGKREVPVLKLLNVALLLLS